MQHLLQPSSQSTDCLDFEIPCRQFAESSTSLLRLLYRQRQLQLSLQLVTKEHLSVLPMLTYHIRYALTQQYVLRPVWSEKHHLTL